MPHPATAAPATPLAHAAGDMRAANHRHACLKEFSISWFSVIMGLAGYTVAWRRAETILGLPFSLSPWLLALTSLIGAAVVVVFAAKIIRHPDEVSAELRHPAKIVFAPTFSIALMLLSVAYRETSPAASFWLFAIGAPVHLGLVLYIMSSWIHHEKYEISHLNPAWIIPISGSILVPTASMPWVSPEVGWFFFGFGLFFWPVLTAIVFYRLIFHGSLAERFMPTLFIFIAPPAVSMTSYFYLTGSLDAFTRVLYAIALFFTLLLFLQVSYFRKLRFFLSWWAYTFPLAAVTSSTLIMARETHEPVYAWIAIALLTVLTGVLALLFWRTGLALVRRELCIEEPGPAVEATIGPVGLVHELGPDGRPVEDEAEDDVAEEQAS